MCLAISRTLNSRDARGPVVKRLIAQRMSVPYGSAVAPYGSAAHGGGVGDCENELSLAGAKDEAAHFDTSIRPYCSKRIAALPVAYRTVSKRAPERRYRVTELINCTARVITRCA